MDEINSWAYVLMATYKIKEPFFINQSSST